MNADTTYDCSGSATLSFLAKRTQFYHVHSTTWVLHSSIASPSTRKARLRSSSISPGMELRASTVTCHQTPARSWSAIAIRRPRGRRGPAGDGGIRSGAVARIPFRWSDARGGRIQLAAPLAGALSGDAALKMLEFVGEPRCEPSRLLVHRFRNFNHIWRPDRAYRTKCGRRDCD